jgi:hypothetical protein
MGALERIVDDGGTLSWLLVGVLALSVLENVIDGDLIWTVFLLAALGILVLPAVVLRDWSAILPPEVTALAVLPGVSRAFGLVWVTDYVVYVGVAALALAVVAELVLFTEAEMSHWFADVMVVLTTMAAIGLWAVLQFYSDRYLGTALILSPDAVMWEFIRATVAGVAAALVFELYFAYQTSADSPLVDVPEGGSG